MKNFKSINQKAPLILDALDGAMHLYPQPEIFLFPFVDYVSILFQSPVVITFWEDKQLRYSSFKDNFHVRHIIPSWPEDGEAIIDISRNWKYQMIAYTFQGDDLVPDKEVASVLCSLIEMGEKQRIFDSGFFDTVEKSVEKHARDEWLVAAADFTESPQSLANEKVLELLHPMRCVLDEAFEDAFFSHYLNLGARGGPNIMNVFFVIRTVQYPDLRYSDAFNYTANLFLSTRQRESLEKWLQRSKVKEQVRKQFGGSTGFFQALEQYLGPKSRSIADAVFSSGHVDFGRRPGALNWDVADGPLDEGRKRAEDLLYGENGEITQFFDPRPFSSVRTKKTPPLFYIPIHVGGTPWFSIFTITYEDPAKNFLSWRHNYSLYRDVIPPAARHIRSTAREVYLREITEIFARRVEMKKEGPSEIAKHVSDEWNEMAQIYPFDLFECRSAEGGTAVSGCWEAITVPGIGGFLVGWRDNPYFRRQIRYGLLDRSSLLTVLKEGLRKRMATVEDIERRSIAFASHLLRTPLDNLKNLISNLPQTKLKKAIEYRTKLLSKLDDFANAMFKTRYRDEWRMSNESCISFGEFSAELSELIESAIKVREASSFAGNLAAIVRRLVQGGRIQKEFEYSNLMDDSKTIKYYPVQLFSVTDVLLDNALRTIGDSRNERLSMSIGLELGGEESRGVFLTVRNWADREENYQNVVRLADRLSAGSVDMVGTSTVYFGCQACGYNPPKWDPHLSRSGAEIVAKVQVAELHE
ncbi:hypothetical protein ACFLQ0_03465 [Nitrospinota bacterium]